MINSDPTHPADNRSCVADRVGLLDELNKSVLHDLFGKATIIQDTHG